LPANVTDALRDPPSPDARPPRAASLAAVAAGWDASDPLPAAVVHGVLDHVQRRLDAGGATPVDGADWPAGWPTQAHALPAMAALARLESEIVAELLARGALDAETLQAVHVECAAARERVLANAGHGPQTVQQALEARDRQLSIATHELRTPISSILLNLQMLERVSRERGTLDAASVGKLLEVPSRQLRRLARMVGLLLDAAQVEAERLVLNPEPLDLCELVQDAAARLQELAHARGCRLTLEACQPLPGLWDRLRMEQVITNLLTNAIKYGGGRVEVRTERGAHAVISVRDHGLGIPPEDQARIFKPFERLASSGKEDGAGLGLYIVNEIVRAHGGRIELQSAVGQGSTFTVLLPI
jgi:signal transduction histidine kinase